MQELDGLWGGILDRLSVDITHQSLGLDIRVVHGGSEETHRLDLHGVSDLRFSNSIPSPWDYAELTEIHAGPLPGGRIHLEMIFWSEDARLAVDADTATIDGTPVITHENSGHL